MSVKKQIPSLCKLHLFYEEISKEFLDEIDIASYFYHTIFDFSQSQHRIARVIRSSNKKSFAIKLFQFCDLETQQRYILQKGTSLVWSTTCGISQKTFAQASKCIQIPLPKPTVEIRSTKSEDNLFAHYYNDTFQHPIRQIRLSIRFGNNNSCVFSLKIFELHGNQFNLTETVNLNHREIHHLYKNRYYVANECEINESNSNV